jgi:hypothetical protein
MIKATSVLTLAAFLLAFSSASLAGHPTYGITNDDNPTANTGTVFVPAAGGKLTILKTLQTGGTGLGGGYFSAPRVAIESNVDCLFVADQVPVTSPLSVKPLLSAWLAGSRPIHFKAITTGSVWSPLNIFVLSVTSVRGNPN